MSEPEATSEEIKDNPVLSHDLKQSTANFLLEEAEDSEDENELVQGMEYDLKYTYNNLRKTKLLETNEPEPFRFYEFGLHPVGFQELLSSIKTMKKLNRSATSPSKARIKTKTFDIRAYQKEIDLQKSLPTSSKSFRISAFRPKTPKWDGSHQPDPELVKDLYRIPCRDPTGKVIFSLMRDDIKLRPDQKPWKPSEAPKDLPEPTFEQCAVSFQKQALLHLTKAIETVEVQYRKLPEKTQEQGNLRARVGADLNNLKMERDRIIAKIKNNSELLEHHPELIELINRSPKKGSHSKSSGHH